MVEYLVLPIFLKYNGREVRAGHYNKLSSER